VRRRSSPARGGSDAALRTPFTFKADFARGRGCRRRLAHNEAEVAPAAIPRVTRLLALAHYLEDEVRSGGVKDYAELARVLGVTRARMTQLLNLLLLAPDIQEQVLNLPAVEKGREPVAEHNLRRVAVEPDWARQREEWAEFTRAGD
jgi:hypothetical protein